MTHTICRPTLLSHAIILAFALPHTALANPDTELPTITVQGQAATVSRGSVITGETLRQQGAQNIQDLVLYQAGVDVQSNNTQGGHSSFTIRGMAENRIAMNIDGIALPETNRDLAAGGGTSETSGRDLFETDTLKSVHILKGGEAAHSGNGALAASVNLTTYSPEDFLHDQNHYAEARYQYRSAYQSHGFGATLAGRHDQATGLLIFTHRNFHQADNAGGTAGTAANQKAANAQDSKQFNILAKANFGTGEHRLETTFEHFQRDTDTQRADQINTTPRGGRTITGYTATDEYRRRRLSLRYLYRPQNHTWLTQTSVHAYHQNTETHDNSISTTASGSTQQHNQTQNRQTGLQVALNGHAQTGAVTHQFNIDMGFSRTQNERLRHNATTTNSYFPPATRHNMTIGAQDKMHFGQTALELGLRYEHESTRFKPDAAYIAATTRPPYTTPVVGKQTHHALLPAVRISQDITPELTAFAAYSHAWRSPTALNQAAGYTNVIPGRMAYRILPNPNLKPETARHFETGLHYQNATWQGKLNVYRSQYRNLISEGTQQTAATPGPVPYFEYQFVNIPRALTYGIEASADYQLNSNWQISGALTWMRGKNQTDGQALPDVHPLTGNLGIAYTQDNWGISGHWRWAAAQNRVPSGGLTTSGYGVVDASVFYRPSKHVQLNLSVYNIGNKRYWTYADVARQTAATVERQTQPGRNVHLGLTARF